MGSGRRVEGAVAGALFATAMVVGVLYCRAFERSKALPEPWVKELAAAVAFACGHGFVDPGYAPSPAVAAFLEKQTDSITCADLPGNAPMGPPNFTQALYRYMTLSVGLTWRLFGISWTKLAVLLGLLYAVSAVAVYGVFRLATNRASAAAGALIMTVSPIQLRYLPQLRDYAKAPFILTLVFLLGLLVVRPFGRGRLLALATAYGAVMGIGFGFRNDLLINTLPFIVTVALFLPAPIRSHLKTKLAALALCAVSFVVCAWPIVTAYRSGSNTGHVALLGLMTHFNGPLGVTGSVYDWGAPYDDGFAIKVVTSFAERVHLRSVSAMSSAYDRTAVEYLLLIGRHWPADLLIRGYASVLKVIELPFQIRAYTTAVPPAVGEGVAGAYAVWVGLLSRVSGIGLAVAAFGVLTVASASVRLAIWLLGTLLYFAGYPAVQFDARHFFFLEFIPWLALALTWEGVRGLVTAARKVPTGEMSVSELVGRGRGVLAFGIGAMVALGAPVAVLRAYQEAHVTTLVDSYLAAATEDLTLSHTPIDGQRILLHADARRPSPEREGQADYLVVDVTRRNCPRLLAPITFRYETASGYTDLSERVYVPVPHSDAPFRLFLPVYGSPGQHFAGVELMESDEGCIAAVRRVVSLEGTPVLLNLTLPPDWRRMRLYQTLTDWEQPSAPYRVRVYAWPRTVDPAPLRLSGMTPPLAGSLSHSRLVASDAAGRWIIRGTAWYSTSFLARLPERPVSKGASFVLRGTLYRGGFTVGLLKNDLWTTSVNVVVPGEFLAVVQAPADGPYVPALANYLTGISRRNDFVVTTLGWADVGGAVRPASTDGGAR
jgi:hypothetical protein